MNLYQHLNLLERYDRTTGLFSTLNEFISKDDVIIDAGSGSGLLSLLSVHYGAKMVYAIERDPIIRDSIDLAKENGCAERIIHINKNLHEISPEWFNHQIQGILAFVYMNDPRRDEERHQLVYNLIEKMNLKEVKLMPNKVRYYKALVHLKNHDIFDHHNATINRINDLSKKYELNLECLHQKIEKEIDFTFYPKRNAIGNYDESDKTFLSDVEHWHEVNFKNEKQDYPDSLEFEMIKDGHPNAVVWKQELLYDEKVIFSNEAISHIKNPIQYKKNAKISVKLDEHWRESNILYIV